MAGRSRPQRCFVKDGVMASVTLEMDLPEGVVVSSYERVGDGHGFEVCWPLPERCRCNRCQHEEEAHLEFKDTVQVIRDLEVWGQSSFWVLWPLRNLGIFPGRK